MIQATGCNNPVSKLTYILAEPTIILRLLGQHVQMVAFTLVFAIAIAVPVGVLVNSLPRIQAPIMSLLVVIYTIPSLALIIFLVPWLGLNASPVIAATTLYCQVVLVRNLVTGLRGIPEHLLEAAKALGMNPWQRWWLVEVPLVLPTFLAGVRLGAVATVAIATLGAKFSAGGLGTLLFDGIAQVSRYDKIWAGVIVVSILAATINSGLYWLEKRFSPPIANTQNTPSQLV
jgi:osmoprotectant transport system permease protein